MRRAGLVVVALGLLACKRANDSAPPRPDAASSAAATEVAPPAAQLASTGLPVCDSYFADFQHCIERVPEDMREDLRGTLARQRARHDDAVASGDSARVIEGCYDERESAVQALRDFGCTFARVDDPPRAAPPAVADKPTPRRPAAPIGVPECDAFIVGFARCIDEKFPESERERMWEAYDLAAESIAQRQRERQDLVGFCKAATDAVRSHAKRMGCTWMERK